MRIINAEDDLRFILILFYYFFCWVMITSWFEYNISILCKMFHSVNYCPKFILEKSKRKLCCFFFLSEKITNVFLLCVDYNI